MKSIDARINRLERAVGDQQAACACGANWPGSVALSVAPDGVTTPRCLVCGSLRPDADLTDPVKVYADWMFDDDAEAA